MSARPLPSSPAPLVPQPSSSGMHPVTMYLGRLATSGRRSMRQSLGVAAEVLARCGVHELPWHLVRYEHVQALRSVLVGRYQPATVNRTLAAVRGVVKECWRLGLIPSEVLQRVGEVKGLPRGGRPAGRMLSQEELASLWAVATDEERVLLALLFRCGLRREEAAAVRACDVEILDPRAVVVRVHAGKGGKDRDVPASGRAAEVLARRASSLGGEELLAGVTSGRSAYRRLDAVRIRAGIAPCSPHDLRRSFVSHALDASGDLATVATMAGHSDPRTTARYDRRGMDSMRAVAEALDDLET